MFIVENTNTFQEEFNNFPEITDWSNDSYNILEASLFFNEELNNIAQATAVAEVVAYNEGAIESFNESAFETVKNKIKQLWAKFKAFVLKVRDRFMAWIRKTFMSNGSFWSKYGSVIEDNIGKLERKNPKISAFDVDEFIKLFDDLFFFVLEIEHATDKDAVINAYNDYMEKLSDTRKEMDNELDKSTEYTVKEIVDTLAKFKIKINKNTYKDLENFFKNGTDKMYGTKDLEELIKDDNTTLKALEKRDQNNLAISNALYITKLSKEAYTINLNMLVKCSKKIYNIITKIGYEAVKLQNTKEEDIKEESASIDLLNKYLQRI